MDWERTVGSGVLEFIARQISNRNVRHHIRWQLQSKNPVWRSLKIDSALFLNKQIRSRYARAFAKGNTQSFLLEKTSDDIHWLMSTVLALQLQVAENRDAERDRKFQEQCAIGEAVYARFTPGSIVWIEYRWNWYDSPMSPTWPLQVVHLPHEIPLSTPWPSYARPTLDSALWHSPTFLSSSSSSSSSWIVDCKPFPCPLLPPFPPFPGEASFRFRLSDLFAARMKFTVTGCISFKRELENATKFGNWELEPIPDLKPHMMTRSVCLDTPHEFSPSYYAALRPLVFPFLPIHDLVSIVLHLAGQSLPITLVK